MNNYNYLILIALILIIAYFLLNKQYTTVLLAVIIFVAFFALTGDYVAVFV